LSDDLLQGINDTIFDNSFTNQQRFNCYEPCDNENDKILDPNVIVNVDNGVDDEVIPSIPEFKDASGSTLIISHN